MILLKDKIPFSNASILSGFGFGLTCKNLGSNFGIVKFLK